MSLKEDQKIGLRRKANREHHDFGESGPYSVCEIRGGPGASGRDPPTLTPDLPMRAPEILKSKI